MKSFKKYLEEQSKEITVLAIGAKTEKSELEEYTQASLVHVKTDCELKSLYSTFPDLVDKLKIGRVGGDFYWKDSDLPVIDPAPLEVKGSMIITYNSIAELKNIPKRIGRTFECDHNELTTFKGCPEVAREMYFDNNKITSLVGIHHAIKECDIVSFDGNYIEEGGIGLIFVKGLAQVRSNTKGFDMAVDIIDKYLGQGKAGLLACQEELEEAGLGRYAKL